MAFLPNPVGLCTDGALFMAGWYANLRTIVQNEVPRAILTHRMIH